MGEVRRALSWLVCLLVGILAVGCSGGNKGFGKVTVSQGALSPGGEVPCMRDEEKRNLKAHIWPNRLVSSGKASWLIFQGDPAKKTLLHSSVVDQDCRAARQCSLVIPSEGKIPKSAEVTACFCVHDDQGRLCPDSFRDRACGACQWVD